MQRQKVRLRRLTAENREKHKEQKTRTTNKETTHRKKEHTGNAPTMARRSGSLLLSVCLMIHVRDTQTRNIILYAALILESYFKFSNTRSLFLFFYVCTRIAKKKNVRDISLSRTTSVAYFKNHSFLYNSFFLESESEFATILSCECS